jgi:protein-S-isoprenylcysteine O-methyltransferase Ste14
VSKFKWSNIPIPEGHVITLVVGIALHIWKPLFITQTTWLIYLFGGSLLLAGILLAGWAVVTVNAIDVAKPTMVITTGPYAFSRNPMYVAWTTIYLALALLVNTWWLILLLPVLLIFIHFRDIRQEERQLEKEFGEQYREYRARVRRYL